MGRSYTPKYRVEYRDNMIAIGKSRGDAIGFDGKRCNSVAWSGTASHAALETWRAVWNESFKPGGCNYHISEGYGAIVNIHHAAIVRQSDGAVRYISSAAAFVAD